MAYIISANGKFIKFINLNYTFDYSLTANFMNASSFSTLDDAQKVIESLIKSKKNITKLSIMKVTLKAVA